jgi:alpha-glucosidase (family GH31 glycosyl hydrolase)
VNDDPSVIDVFRRYAVLREALVPYLKAQAREAIETGRPLMRALCFDYGADLAVWDHPHQYLLGSDLLVSPVIEGGATEWSTYLPAGSWVDVWTGQPVDGGSVVVRPTPRDLIPVYSRAAAWPALANVFGG